jgi:hypothetical protein
LKIDVVVGSMFVGNFGLFSESCRQLSIQDCASGGGLLRRIIEVSWLVPQMLSKKPGLCTLSCQSIHALCAGFMLCVDDYREEKNDKKKQGTSQSKP